MAGVRTIFVLLGVALVGRQALAALNSACNNDSDCSSVEYAACIGNVCKCNTTTHVEVNRECQKVATHLGEGCIDAVQCTKYLGQGTECIESQCSCKQGFTAAKGQQTCLPIVAVGGNCEEEQQCQPTNVTTCKDGICSCRLGYSQSSTGRCLADKSYGEPCTEPSECSMKLGNLAGCRNEKCVCEENTYYNGSWCLKKNELREPCNLQKSEGCFQDETGYKYIECIEGTCQCIKSAKESKDGKCESSGVEQVTFSTILLLVSVMSFTFI